MVKIQLGYEGFVLNTLYTRPLLPRGTQSTKFIAQSTKFSHQSTKFSTRYMYPVNVPSTI
jgi:hypothetical protein